MWPYNDYRPSVPFERLVPLFKWRASEHVQSPRSLAASLSVEGLPHGEIPKKHYDAVKGFRRRSHKARAALCKRFFRQQ